jgi:acetylornithine aminotransferase
MTHIIPFYDSCGIQVTESKGCYLYDKEGKAYLDLESGVWCANLGYNHKRINRALQRQLDKTMHLGLQVESALPEQLSRALLKKLMFFEGRSVFLSSGSEAVDLALTIAQHLTGRKGICKLEDSYLSAYGHASAAVKNRDLLSIRNNDYEKLASLDFKKMAAFIFEPGTAWGMIRFPSSEFITSLVKKARSGGCLLIVDEVTTGLGRTGKWFGFEHYRLQPDIVACGKGLGNGYPVSSVIMNKNTSDAFAKDPFRYAQSHQNDPLGCAVALEVIKEIDRTGLVHASDEKGSLFKSLLKKIRHKHKMIKEVRGHGLMLAMEFHDADIAARVHRDLLDRQIITGIKTNVLRFMPPLIIGHDLLHDVGSKIDDSLGYSR